MLSQLLPNSSLKCSFVHCPSELIVIADLIVTAQKEFSVWGNTFMLMKYVYFGSNNHSYNERTDELGCFRGKPIQLLGFPPTSKCK